MHELTPQERARQYAELSTIAQVLREDDPDYEIQMRQALEGPVFKPCVINSDEIQNIRPRVGAPYLLTLGPSQLRVAARNC